MAGAVQNARSLRAGVTTVFTTAQEGEIVVASKTSTAP